MEFGHALTIFEAVEKALGQRCAVHLISTMGVNCRTYHVEVRWGHLTASDIAALEGIARRFDQVLEVTGVPNPDNLSETTSARFRDYTKGRRL